MILARSKDGIVSIQKTIYQRMLLLNFAKVLAGIFSEIFITSRLDLEIHVHSSFPL